jgi:hypothetical protein
MIVEKTEGHGTGFEPVRLFSIEELPREIILRPYNFGLEDHRMEEIKLDKAVMSLVSVKSFPATPISPPHCDITFRTWADKPSSAFMFKEWFETHDKTLVVVQYAGPTAFETDQVARRIRVSFDSVEWLPFHLDMTGTGEQALEAVRLINARYEFVEE